MDTVLHSPHTDRVRMIVVESGAQRAGEWVTIRRNVVEDFRRAFDEEPGDIVSVGLMTDYGDDGSPRRAVYGDITFAERSMNNFRFSHLARRIAVLAGRPAVFLAALAVHRAVGAVAGRCSASAIPGSW